MEEPLANFGLSTLLAAAGHFQDLLCVGRARSFTPNAEIKSMSRETLWTQEDVPRPAGCLSAQPLIQS